jgi:hypothetical protein
MSKNIIILTSLIVFLVAFLFFAGSRGSYEKEIRTCTREKSNTCWVSLIKSVFENDGLSEALGMVEIAYSLDPGFSSSCHDIGHYLGSETYRLYKNGREFEINSKTAFCSYGFYHGFMESMITSGAEIEDVRGFCDYVDVQMSKETPDATLQCFHGIGHGWVNVHDQKNLWGDDMGIALYGLSLCEKISNTESETNRCATGVFNGISFFYLNGEYNITPRKDDPLWLCKAQGVKYQDPCFLSMNSFILSFSGGDFGRAASYFMQIKDARARQNAILNLAATFGAKNPQARDYSEAIILCRRLGGDLTIPCIQGYVFAFLENGEPGREYERPLEICKNTELSVDEEEGCLSYIYSYFAQWYSAEKAYKICDGQKEYKAFCKQKVSESIDSL